MRKRPKKPAASSPEPQGPARNSVKFSQESLDEELDAAYESGDSSHLLELLDSAPQWIRNQPEFMLYRATALMSLGDEQGALRLLLGIARKNPRFSQVNAPLAMLYMDRECPAHALQEAQRALAGRHVLEEARDMMEEIIEEATAMLQHLASKFNVSMDVMRQAAIFHENALSAMDEDKLMDVDFNAQKAIKLIPTWTPPYNNRARALYFTGRFHEAISSLESVLALEPENVFALSSLVKYHFGLDQLDQARVYADRLVALIPQLPVDGMDIDQVITALALLEDTPELWKIAQSYLHRPADILYGRSWHCLAVAAARSGKWKNALDLMSKADEEDELSPAGEAFMEQLYEAKRLRKPGLAWMPPEYPGADLLVNPKIITDLVTLSGDFSGPIQPSQQRKLESILQKNPFVKQALKLLLKGKDTFPLALNILADLNQPDADAAILRFASGQDGNQEARMRAITTLIQTGRYTGPKSLKLWNEELGEWRDVALSTQRIGDIPPKAQPKTLVLIEKANRAKKPEEAISLLRKAVEIEPTCAAAIFNLGVMLAQNGNEEEGEALIHKSVMVDPSYTFGHANIALREAERGAERAALDHLEVITSADQLATETAVIANLAWHVLALQKLDVKTARKHFDLAASLNPEHRLLKEYETQLKAAESMGFILNFQRESTIRAHQRLSTTALTAVMDLRTCLETNTKDMLSGTARFLRASSSGKKAELASRLAERLLDSEFLEQTLVKILEKHELEALGWVLEAGGVRPWNEFVHKFGDDLYESTFWIYHEPQSIPGRLRMSGLFYSGTLEGETVAFIPSDVRALLRKLVA